MFRRQHTAAFVESPNCMSMSRRASRLALNDTAADVVSRNCQVELVVVFRRKKEGALPIFDREAMHCVFAIWYIVCAV